MRPSELTISGFPDLAFDFMLTRGTDPTSTGIKLATCSPWTHAAICAWVKQKQLKKYFPEKDWHNFKDQTLIFESTSESCVPCCITGRKRGLVAHRMLRWISHYHGKIYRYEFNEKILPEERDNLANTLLTLLKTNIPYDTTGALLAGTRILKWLPCLSRVVGDRQSRFCVETSEGVVMNALVGRKLPSFDPGRDRPRDLARLLRRSPLWKERVRIV